MSTNKHIDKICIAVIAVTIVISMLIITLSNLGVIAGNSTIGYENRLFDTSTVHSVDIVMNDWDSFIANCENEEYSSCTVVIDGEKYANIGIRAKGNTSLSSVSTMGSQRYSFKLEFDQYEEGKSYYGLDKLCLNNLIQDNTMMKDYIVYRMMADFGVDSPLSSYVYITVNGEDWGLYLAVEGIEDSFLQRNYQSTSGDMYKPDSLSFGAGRGNGKEFDMSEFDFSGNSDSANENSDNNTEETSPSGNAGDSSSDSNKRGSGKGFGGNFPAGGFSGQMPSGDNFPSGDFSGQMPSGDNFPSGDFGGSFGMGSDDVKLKYIDDDPDSYSNIFNNAKTEVTDSDKERLIASIKNLSEYTDLENTVDIDEVLRYFVVHNFVVNGDSYTGTMIHNYYLYEEDGKLSMIPWDYNLAFGTFMGGNATSSVNSSIDNPISTGSVDDRPMIGWIFSNEEYTQMYHTLFAEFVEKWYDSGKLAKLIEDTAEMIRPYVEKDPTKFCTNEEFETGLEALSQFVDLRFQSVKNQLNGDSTSIDASDINTSAMGTMNNGGGMGGEGKNFGPDRSSSSDSTAPSGDFDSSNIPEMGGSFNPFGNGGSFNPGGQGDSSDSDENGSSSTSGQNSNSFGPGANSNFDVSKMGNMNFSGTTSASFSAVSTLMLLGISVLVLAVGLLIAVKKKY